MANETLKQPLLVSKREAALALGVCLRTLDYLIARDELKYIKIGSRVLIPYTSLVAFTRRSHGSPSSSENQ